MKIGYLLQQHVDIQTPPFSGPANHVREVVEHLQKLGHAVLVIVNIDGRLYKTDDLHTFTPIMVNWLDKGPLRWLEKAVRRLQSELKLPYAAFFESFRFAAACRQELKDVDLLLERMSWMLYGGALTSRFLKVPLVLENNGDHLADLEAKGIAPTGWQRTISIKVTAWAVNTAVHIAVSGDGWRQEFIKRWHIPETKITTIENGTILVDTLNREQLRSFKNLPPRQVPQLVYLGGFYPWQGVPNLLRAFGQVIEQGLQAELILIGSGLGFEEAEQIVAELELGELVTFTGRLAPDKYAPLLADADVGLAPYCGWPEYSGLKTFDYKAAGLPTISTGEDGMPRTLSHGRNALIIPPCDDDALADAMQQLLQDAALRQEMGQAARIEAETDNSWDHTVQALLAVFQQLLAAQAKDHSAESPSMGMTTK